MYLVLGVVILIFSSMEAREAPKIQIFEIRDRGDKGIELRNLDLNSKSQQRVESKLLNLFRSKKETYDRNDVTNQLIEKFKNLKGDEGNRISDESYIYILNNIFHNDHSSEEVFVDETRNLRANPNLNKYVLKKLLNPDLIRDKKKKRVNPRLLSSKKDRVKSLLPRKVKKPNSDYIKLKALSLYKSRKPKEGGKLKLEHSRQLYKGKGRKIDKREKRIPRNVESK